MATVLAFLLDFGAQFGLAIILSPLTYLVGVSLLLWALPALQEEDFISKGTTLHSFIGRSFNNDSLRIVTAGISTLGYIGILIIEIHVGVQIFRLFTQDTTALALVSILLTTLIGVYTWLGGYQTVVDTDKIQLTLIALAVCAGFAVTISLMLSTGDLPSLESFVPDVWNLPASLITVMVIGNIPLQILRMSNWQRIAAVGEITKVRSGLKRAIIWSFFFWFAFNILGILLGGLSIKTGAEFSNLHLLLVAEQVGRAGAYLALPLLFTGMLAALISTADSILVPILTAVIYDFLHHDQLHINGFAKDSTPEERKRLLLSARYSLPVILLITVCLYWVLVGYANFDFISLLFVFFNQQLVLFPAVIIALDPEKEGLKKVSSLVITAVVLGWISVWVATFIGVQTGNQSLVFYAATIGFGVATLIPLAVKRGRSGILSALRRLFYSSKGRITSP